MNYLNIIKKNISLSLILILLSGCNYKPLYNKENLGQLSFKTIEIDGDKRIAQIVVNKLNINKDPLGDLALLIDAKKKISVSNKNSSGKILEYNMILNFRVEIKDNSKNETIYSKNISNAQNYKSSKMYSDTINAEKKIIENIANITSKQIINEISLVLRNDI